MKRIVTLFAACLLAWASMQACMKKSPELASDTMRILVGLVQDTTQALLPEAVVSFDGREYTTSWDGRFIFPLNGRTKGKLSVKCEGYKSQKIDLSELDLSRPLIVSLIPTASRAEKHPTILGRGRTGAGLYKVSPLAAEDVYYTLETSVAEVDGKAMPSPYRPVPNDVAAGKLTAGEVNDFAKWQLWPDILDSTHRAFIPDWRLEARERYTVQVTNRNGYPIVNYPVNLVDKNGNTVFQALTDNTGKAELWNGLTGKSADVDQPHWQTITLDEECNYSQAVDVLFVFDATGSMGDELMYLQAEMKDVISRASQATGGLAIRTGAVVYRDHEDEYLTRLSPLTGDIAVTQAFIDKQEANGGGDYPEAVPEALMAAINSAGWDADARARIVFLILDAPCHQDSATIALLHEQILNAASFGIRVVPVVCSGLQQSGELLMRSIALATNGTSFFLTDDSGIGRTHLKPTTDSIVVEHLNDMLVRTIVEFSYLPDCTGHWHEDVIENVQEQFIPDPFDAKDIESNPDIAHGETTLYLLDISGKLIYVYQGVLDEASDSQLSGLRLTLATGIYFVKAFYDGEWHTKKILVH